MKKQEILKQNFCNFSFDASSDNMAMLMEIFEILYRISDTKTAIQTVISNIGSKFNVSRVYIFEDSIDHKYTCNTFEWCANGISAEIETLAKVPYESLGEDYRNNFNEDGLFFCPDIYELPKEQIDILEPQGIKSMLQCAMLDNKTFCGYIGFDECQSNRKWSQEQIFILVFATKIISGFLKKLRQQEELQRNAQLMENSMKIAKVCTWEYDVIHNETRYSTSAQAMLQSPPIRYNPMEYNINNSHIHSDSIDDYKEIYKANNVINKTEPIKKDIYVRIGNNKEYNCLRMIVQHIFSENGSHISSLGVCMDVTELKKSEMKYQKQINDFQNIKDYNLILKETYNITQNNLEYRMINQDYKSLYQVDSAKNISYDVALEATINAIPIIKEKLLIKDILCRNNLINEYKNGKTFLTVEYKRLLQNKGVVYIRCIYNLFSNPKTNDIMCFVSNYNITKEKNTSEMMRQVVNNEYDYLALLDGNTQNLLLIQSSDNKNIDGDIGQEYNYEEKLNYYLNNYLPAKDRNRYLEYLNYNSLVKELNNKMQVEIIANVMKKNDDLIHRKKITATYLDKQMKQILISCTDVTSIYQEEEQQKKDLQIANDAKSTFLSTVSHDMRTPLNDILGLTDLMLERQQNEQNITDLKQLKNAGKYLLSLINDTLDVSKIESGKLEFHPTVFYGKEVLDSTMNLVNPLLVAKNIKLNMHVKKRGFTYVYADIGRWQQIIMNIMSNAIKFSNPNSSIDVFLENISIENNTVLDRYIIKDYGIGMSQEFLPHIFEPFEQEHTGSKTNYGGTGLGMSITKNLVELMGGHISVESELNKGTTFTFTIPIKLANDEQIAAFNKIEHVHNQMSVNRLKGTHILICEDHPLNFQIVSRILKKWGCIVYHAENGEIGLDMFDNSAINYYNAILMDIRMPNMDGLETTRKIRALTRKDAQSIPIIAMSANAFDDDIKKSLSAGMNEHLSKPIEIEQLLNCLNEYIV